MTRPRASPAALQIASVAAVLALDLWTGEALPMAALYALAILLPRPAGREISPAALAFLCTALIVAGFYAHASASLRPVADRLIALFVVWAAAVARARGIATRAAIQRGRDEVGELADRLEQGLAERERMLADKERRARIQMSVLEDLAREVEIRTRAEASLRLSRARARSILDHAPDAIITIDREGRVTGWNPAAERFGWTEEEALGRLIDDLIVPEESQLAHHVSFRRFVETGEGSVLNLRRELWAQTRSGERIPVEITVVPVPIGDGFEYSAFLEDISVHNRMLAEQRALAQRLQAAVDSLRVSNAELEQFAYVASHDLQTPLRAIAGFAEVLEEDYSDVLDEDGREHLGRIVGSVERMQRLIHDLLAYSRVDSRPLQKEEVELDRVLDEALAQLEDELLEAGAKVHRAPLPRVQGDRGLLVQLFQNLIANALKYRADRQAEVTVGARAEEGGWTVSFQDNGIGIDPRHHERIFEIFRRLHAQAEIPGTGIGLAICRRVVALHQGRIWVESEPGRGARFFVHLPAGEEALQPAGGRIREA